MSALSVIAALAAVLGGTALQRIAGFGFALVAAPIMALLLGPFEGIMVINAVGVLSAGLVLSSLRRNVQWRKVAYLVPAGLLGVLPGAWVALNTNSRVLSIIVGLGVMVGLSSSLFVAKHFAASGRLPMIGLGFAGGFLSVTAGAGGPALTIYGVLIRWSPAKMAATVQPVFAAFALSSLLVKVIGQGGWSSTIPATMWLGLLLAALCGLVLGSALAPRCSAEVSRKLVIAIAYLGSVATVLKAVL